MSEDSTFVISPKETQYIQEKTEGHFVDSLNLLARLRREHLSLEDLQKEIDKVTSPENKLRLQKALSFLSHDIHSQVLHTK
jgi:hypothetical protein